MMLDSIDGSCVLFGCTSGAPITADALAAASERKDRCHVAPASGIRLYSTVFQMLPVFVEYVFHFAFSLVFTM